MDESFQIAYEICKAANSNGFKFLKKVIDGRNSVDSLEKNENGVRNKLNATKFQTYCRELNPSLEVHEVYRKSVYVPDYLRVCLTRLRLMSHNLKIETGRWSRLPREDRVCQCDRISVQDEKHVLLDCPMSAQVRRRYQLLPFESVNSLMKCNNVLDLVKFVKEILECYVLL